MFSRMAPPQTAPPPQASSAPHIVSIVPVSALPQVCFAAKMEEPMNSAPSQPPPKVKKGFSRVKGSSAIAMASNIMVPTSAPSAQPAQQPTVAPPPRLQSLLQALEQEEYGTNTCASSFAASRSEEPSDTGDQVPPPPPTTFPSVNWSRRLANFFPFPTQQWKRTTSWARH